MAVQGDQGRRSTVAVGVVMMLELTAFWRYAEQKDIVEMVWQTIVWPLSWEGERVPIFYPEARTVLWWTWNEADR